MKVIIRNPKYKEVKLYGLNTVSQVLRKLNLNSQCHLVAKNGVMATEDEAITNEDVLEIISAISGGA